MALAGLFLPLLAGCYTYTTVPLDNAPVGEDVRLVVTREGARELLNVVETEEAAPVVDGVVTGREGESLLLRVPLPTDPQAGTRLLEIGQVVRVPLGEILSVERREFSGPKSGLLTAGIVAGATVIVVAIINAGRGDPGLPGDDPDVLFDLLRIPIR